MKKVLHSHHPVRHVKSFKFAFNGIGHALLNEANFRVQVIITFLSILLGFMLNISHAEWALIALTSGFLLSAEMINTVVEELVDYMFKEYSDVAKVVKDLAAGYVLTAALTTLAVLVIIFLPKIASL